MHTRALSEAVDGCGKQASSIACLRLYAGAQPTRNSDAASNYTLRCGVGVTEGARLCNAEETFKYLQDFAAKSAMFDAAQRS
jgi:hypothetical protein